MDRKQPFECFLKMNALEYLVFFFLEEEGLCFFTNLNFICTRFYHDILVFLFYSFNSLFTVDFSIVITTNLHQLTENFIIKRKI